MFRCCANLAAMLCVCALQQNPEAVVTHDFMTRVIAMSQPDRGDAGMARDSLITAAHARAQLLEQTARSSRQAEDDTARVLDETVYANRLARVLLMYSPEEAEVLRKVGQRQGDLVRGLLSLAWRERLKTVDRLGESDLSDYELSLCIAIGVGDETHVVTTRAAALAERRHLKHALLSRMAAMTLVLSEPEAWKSAWPGGEERMAGQAIVSASKLLADCQDDRSIRLLLGAVLERPHPLLAVTIGKTGHTGAISRLNRSIQVARQPQVLFSHKDPATGKEDWTCTETDPVMMAILALTGQQPSDYDMVACPGAIPKGLADIELLGFRSGDQRSQAIADLDRWWFRAAMRGKFKGVQPLIPICLDRPAPTTTSSGSSGGL